MRSRSRITLGVFVALTIVALFLYGKTLDYPFIYDDNHSIVENLTIRKLLDPEPTPEVMHGTPIAGRPVVRFSLALNYALGKLDVRGYRLLNLAVHVLVALLLYGIVRRTLLVQTTRERFGRHAGAIGFCCEPFPSSRTDGIPHANRATPDDTRPYPGAVGKGLHDVGRTHAGCRQPGA